MATTRGAPRFNRSGKPQRRRIARGGARTFRASTQEKGRRPRSGSRGALCRVPEVRCCIEGGEAPGWQGAKSEHIGNMGAMSNAVRRDASPAECKRTSGTRHWRFDDAAMPHGFNGDHRRTQTGGHSYSVGRVGAEPSWRPLHSGTVGSNTCQPDDAVRPSSCETPGHTTGR